MTVPVSMATSVASLTPGGVIRFAGPGPADEPAKPREQRVEIASTLKTAQPRYTIHLASMRSEVEARAEWGQLQARYPAILGDRVLFTREARISGQGITVRVLTGLFHDRGQAQDLCSQLSSDEQYCAVVRLLEREG